MSDYNEAKAWAPSEERAYDDTKQPAPVDAALLRLDKAQAELREVITRLTDRLAPVSSPTTVLSGGESATAVPRESRSPVVERIDQATSYVQRLTTTVIDAHEALEV